MNIEHVALYVQDLEAARRFFTAYLTGFRSYFITFDCGSRLELMTRPDTEELPKPPARTGYAHIAFSVGSREKVDKLTQQLRCDGYRVASGPRVTGDGYYESCLVGIEENIIEITV